MSPLIHTTELYGSEIWTLSKVYEELLGGFERKVLRIYGAVQIDGVWRRRCNKELYSFLMMLT
jgi:hypothetical protein